MEKLIIKNITENNRKDVLKKLEALGARWASGDKPTANCWTSSVYTVGVRGDGVLTFGGPGPHFYETAKVITADEFIKSYGLDKIVIARKGRKVTATDQDGNHASARCCPEDDFDFYEGARLALERLEEKTRGPKEGDMVRVKDYMVSFTTLSAAYFTTDEELRRYAFGAPPKNGQVLAVERVGHDGKLYASPIYYDGPTSPLYVIRPEGVERVKK